MRLIEQAALAALRRVDAETAHRLALRALNAGLGPKGGPVTSAKLATELAGLHLPNPVGIAAGFDKNAEAVAAALAAGPGFIEVGAVTPRPQEGNPPPRLFRLSEDRAIINRLGFNNEGMEAVGERLRAARGAGVVGVNVGANKDSEDRSADYVTVLRHLWDAADFFTVNVSSPNTERLRELQGGAALGALIGRVMMAHRELGGEKPVFLKIAPDLSEPELEVIAGVALEHGLSGIIATNTTISREGLTSPLASEAGGLSGRPLFARSTEVLRSVYRLTRGRMPLIGVGGIASAEDAYAKIRAGASAVQLYTAMIYQGISLAGRIARGIESLLAYDGFASVSEAVGADTAL